MKDVAQAIIDWTRIDTILLDMDGTLLDLGFDNFFWREHVPLTAFWKVARARLVPAVQIVTLPLSLTEAFLRGEDVFDEWKRLLEFLSPITITGGLAIKVF